jgi:hypothetical protein
MTSLAELFDPATPAGSFLINTASAIAAVAVITIAAWLIGPLRWWIAGRNLKRILLNGRRFVFVFNPELKQSKVMTFLPSGEIGEGRNSNEHTWRIHHGKLEIFAFDGLIYSRFVRDKKSGKLVHTNDSDARSIHGQYIQPHFTPWPRGGKNVEIEFVDMAEATTRAYEQLRTDKSLWADVAEKFSGSGLGKTQEEGVLLYMATAFTTNHVSLYGKRPPSRVYELIDANEFKAGHFADNGNSFVRFGEKGPRYIDIAVRREDFEKLVEQMKKDSSKAI